MQSLPQHLLTERGVSYDTCFEIDTKPGHRDPKNVVVLTGIGPPLTKTFVRTDPFGEFAEREAKFPSLYTNACYVVDGLDDLADLVEDMCGNEYEMIIRGGVIATAPDRHRRRMKRSDDERSIVEVPRIWGMVDIDKSAARLPDDWQNHQEEIVRELVREHLPPAFHDAGVVANWLSSMGFRRDARGIIPKVHLFFWFTRPVWLIELRHWLDPKKVDKSIFDGPEMPNYTAAPILLNADGSRVPDPLAGRRVLRIPGPAVDVPDRIEPREEDRQQRSRIAPGARGDPIPWRQRLDEIRDDGTPLHDQLRDAALAYVNATWPKHSFDELQSAALAASIQFNPSRPQSEIDNRIGDDLRHSFDTAVALVEREREKAAAEYQAVLAKHAKTLKQKGAVTFFTGNDEQRKQALRALLRSKPR